MLAVKLKRIIFIAGLCVGLVLTVLSIVLFIIKLKRDRKAKTNTLLGKEITQTDIETNKEDELLNA